MTVTVGMGHLKSGKAVVALRFPYNPIHVESAKAVPGARWVKGQQFWSYPLDLTTCRLLREAFPYLMIQDELASWARGEISKAKELNSFHSSSAGETARLERVPYDAPTLWKAMQNRGFQTMVPQFAARVGNYFNGSQPGTGKTIETLGSLVECGVGPMILVVAPRKAIRVTWAPEIRKWLAPDIPVGVETLDSDFGSILHREAIFNEIASDRDYPRGNRFHFVIINPEMLRWYFKCDFVKPNGRKCNGKSKTCPQRKSHRNLPQHPSLFEIRWDCIILDETHQMMMHANERSTSVSGWGYGAQKLKVNPGPLNKIGMSGTPFKGQPRRFWPVMHWLRPDKYSGQRKWERTYFKAKPNIWAQSGETITDEMIPERRQLFNDDLSNIMVRHTKRELRRRNKSWAPPEKLHVDIELPMSPKQAKAYKQMMADSTARLEDSVLTAEGILAERTRLKQFSGAYAKMLGGSLHPSLPSNKIDWVMEALEERGVMAGDGDGKIVVASQYVSLLRLLGGQLDRAKVNWLSVFGGDRDVEETQKVWQSAQAHTRVLLLSVKAGGVSLTLDAADDLALLDESDDPDTQEQVEDRVHRTSRTDHQVTVYHLRSRDTIDQVIFERNILRDMEQKGVLDGRRGIEYMREMLGGS